MPYPNVTLTSAALVLTDPTIQALILAAGTGLLSIGAYVAKRMGWTGPARVLGLLARALPVVARRGKKKEPTP